jgi:hypothetical protein
VEGLKLNCQNIPAVERNQKRRDRDRDGDQDAPEFESHPRGRSGAVEILGKQGRLHHLVRLIGHWDSYSTAEAVLLTLKRSAAID